MSKSSYPIQTAHRALHAAGVAFLLTSAASVFAADSTNTTESAASTNAVATAPKAEKGAPLPLHQIEGNGGIFSTLSAYIVNPPREGEWIGRPSVGLAYVNLGHDQNLEAATLTVSPHSRLELGYGYNRLGLGDLPGAIQKATGVSLTKSSVQLHNFNARFQLVKENDWDQKWLPALTVGSHFKNNQGIGRIDEDLGGALSAHKITAHSGEDVTLYASKMFTQLGKPVLLEAGGRATRGVWNGLGGFTSSYDVLFEANAVVFLTSNFALAAEYKQQANQYTPIGDLVKKSGDWFTLDAAYVVNNHWTVAAGYGYFGNVLNHNANGVWGITTKWEF